MTKYLKLFAAFCTIWSVPFFAVLHFGLNDPQHRWPFIVISGPIYGIGFALAGYSLGKKDDQSRVRYSLGDAYSATSNIISAAVGCLWIVLFKPKDHASVFVYLIILLVVLVVGIVRYRRSIKGMSRGKLFQ